MNGTRGRPSVPLNCRSMQIVRSTRVAGGAHSRSPYKNDVTIGAITGT